MDSGEAEWTPEQLRGDGYREEKEALIEMDHQIV
jgi:hypothetical protein